MTINVTPSRTDLDLDAIRLDLDVVATTRERQLAAPAPAPGDTVAARHRASVEQLLVEIRAAIARLDDGTYGLCTTCKDPIPTPRLDLRPWAATCTGCALTTRS